MKNHANADVLSRFPRRVSHTGEKMKDVLQISCDESLLDAKKVAMETAKDPFLKKILLFIQVRWPRVIDESVEYHTELKALSDRREQLNCEHGCITWSNRVVIGRLGLLWTGATLDTVGLFWTNMEKLSIMMPNFIYNVWMVFATVNQSTFHNSLNTSNAKIEKRNS